MNWLQTLTTIFHMLFAASIVGLVLLQRGKGADAGAGFGAGASGTVFGARGSASFLSRATAILATLFFVTSLALAYMGGRPVTQQSVMDRMPAPAVETSTAPAPTTPAPGTAEAPSAEQNVETPQPEAPAQ